MGEEALPLPSPGRCIYGYALYIISNCLLILYLVISLVPDEILDYFNLTYLPSKYWYIAIPTFLSTLIVAFGFVIYPSIVMCLTEPLDSVLLFKDEFSNPKIDITCGNNEEDIPADISSIYDIPVEKVTQLTYFKQEILQNITNSV
ncbi:phosphatidylinositol N-acetylglucosaminyltransferase subunit P [Tetranychus urticae]|uniref:PIG-P domain-containing protein n=1 Tax=Tetranychus urticae TaxID=32264 RepID=T1KLK2_TETUR|nr:phosphatidylinositol N-acetylglucosaminyltransferase subunit P [Tetranychus urticae]